MVIFSGAETVGLDIGESSIKAVRLRQTLSGRKAITYFRHAIPVALRGSNIDQKIPLVKEFMHANRLVGLPVITALSCGELSLRTIGFPFRDIRKVGQLVPNEVEGMIPLPLEEAAVGYQCLPSSGNTRMANQGAVCHVLVAVASRQTLTTHIQRMLQAGFEPTAIQPDALALFSISRYMRGRRPGFPQNLAIIDIGASKTTICLTLRGNPWMVRTICLGLNDLTRSATGPAVASDAHGEYELVGAPGGTMEPGFSTLLRELRLTLHTYHSTAQTTLRHVLFCGGGAGLPAMIATLGQRLRLEPIHVPFLHHVRWRSVYSVALGLVLLEKPSKGHVPFARSTAGSGIDLKRALEKALPAGTMPLVSVWQVGVGCLLIAFLALADLTTHIVLKDRQLQKLSTDLRAEFHQHFPDIDVITDELDQAKTALLAAHRAEELMGGNHVAVLSRLGALVLHFPKGMKLKIIGLTIEPNAVQIEGETDSFESVELMKRGLQAVPEAREVIIRDVSVGTLATQVLFRLVIVTQ